MSDEIIAVVADEEQVTVVISDTGVQGIPGPLGDTGPQGEQGDPGATGSQGPAGAVGPQGLQGDPGVAGGQGPQGSAGVTGSQGPQGSAGTAGPQGEPGDNSTVPGPQGIQGEVGAIGPQGSAGNSDIVVVTHGADPNVVRPDFPAVYWQGSVEPINALDGDLWVEIAPDSFLLYEQVFDTGVLPSGWVQISGAAVTFGADYMEIVGDGYSQPVIALTKPSGAVYWEYEMDVARTYAYDHWAALMPYWGSAAHAYDGDGTLFTCDDYGAQGFVGYPHAGGGVRQIFGIEQTSPLGWSFYLNRVLLGSYTAATDYSAYPNTAMGAYNGARVRVHSFRVFSEVPLP